MFQSVRNLPAGYYQVKASVRNTDGVSYLSDQRVYALVRGTLFESEYLTEVGGEDNNAWFDTKSERLTCPRCKTEWPGQYAHYYRAHAYQSQRKFRPQGVEETQNGFIYLPFAWWNGEATEALLHMSILWAFCGLLLRLAKNLPDIPNGTVACATAALAAASVLYFIVRMLWEKA